MRRWALLFCVLLGAGAAEAATAVWIDTDPSIGAPWREVDDAFALVLAFHSPELRIAGLSTTYGNAQLRRTTAVARDLVRRFGGAAGLTEKDVHPGANAPRDRATRTEATESLARALRQESLTYIALGPLTNLAAFLALHPELSHRIERIILIGGRSPGERFAFGPNKSFFVHDANIYKDAAAAVTVLRAGRPLVLAPIEIAPQLALTPADRRAWRRSGAAGDYLFRRSQVWLWFWTSLVREKGGLVFDALAILPVLQPGLLKTELRFADFAASGDLIARRARLPGARRVQFGTGVGPSAKRLLLERLGKRPGR